MHNKLKTFGLLLMLLGLLGIAGGVAGLVITYQSVARENITTPDDAKIPGTSVRGPFTLKAQADVIRKHVLASTDGKTFAQMPSQIPKLDENNNPIIDDEGNPVMTANTTRDMWITATTLTSALQLGILAYGISALALLVGLVSLLAGTSLWTLRSSQKI